MASFPILFITGANTGLGLETVKSLCQSSKGYTIILGGRYLAKAEAAIKEVQNTFPSSASTLEPVQINVEDDNSIETVFNYVTEKYGHLDVLINNAGTQVDPQMGEGKMTMREAWNKSWDVNTTGTQIVTYTFVPLLLKSGDPRLLFITSGTSTMAESTNTSLAVNRSPAKGWPKPFTGVPAYRASKTDMNMMMREWVRILKEDNVKVFCISPGMLATGLGGRPEMLKKIGALDPSIGANFIRDVVEGARDQDVGKIIRKDNFQPW